MIRLKTPIFFLKLNRMPASSKPYIVQKFGGTSLGNAERLLNVARIISQSLEEAHPVVVVSAMSSYTKAEGTTSRLLEAGRQALEGGPFFRILDLVERTHLEALEAAVEDPDIQAEVQESVHQELRSLKSFLEAIHVIREISPRSQDLIVGTGERLSARLLSGVLRSMGVDATCVDLSECVTSDSELNDDAFYLSLQQDFVRQLPEERRVPVVTGFFGFVQDGIIARIGRGYTDLTAALIAAQLQAEELQIWKEVDGIFSADPRKVPEARVLSEISPEEAAELTYFGSEVIHPFTMERAIKNRVAIRIKNTFAPEKPGTVIVPGGLGEGEVQARQAAQRIAVAVTTKSHVNVLNINSNRMLHASGFIAQVFDAFREHNVVIDLISTSEVNISCTVEKSERLPDLLEDLGQLASVTLERDRAILSLVGEGMRSTVGSAGRMFMALAKAGVNIELITQGASEINISCVIHQADASKALQVIHEEFLN